MSSILGKFKEGVEQVATSVQQRVQEKTTESRLKSEHRQIEREKADQIAALGSTVYEMFRTGSLRTEDLEPPLQALAATDRRLEEKQKELEEFLAAAAQAHAAGQAQAGHPDGADAAAERHCACGAVLAPNAKFCAQCGTPAAAEADPGI